MRFRKPRPRAVVIALFALKAGASCPVPSSYIEEKS
jgi:hypothetical protein